MRHLTFILLLVTLLLTACSRAENTPQLFVAPVEPVVVELQTEALPIWRDAAQNEKPTLVYFAKNPLLEPIPAELAPEVKKLLATGTTQDFRQRGNFYRANPLLVDDQVVSAAIDGGWLAGIVWVFPTTRGLEEQAVEQLSLETFRQQLVDGKSLTQAEADGLQIDRGVVSGVVRGLPFRAVHPVTLPKLTGPLLVHVDLGYFKGLYVNGVKTPVYDLLHRTGQAIKEAGWAPRKVTVSYSTEDGKLSLDSRFIMSNFIQMLKQPQLLEANRMPEAWTLRSQALHARNFFMDNEVKSLFEKAASQFPQDAGAQYDMFRQKVFSEDNLPDGLVYLEKAMVLDPGYAAAFLELAQIAANKKRYDIAAEMLGKAAPFFPDNPMIELHRIDYLYASGRPQDALPIVERLEKLDWSERFHAGVPEILHQMRSAIKDANTSPAPKGEQS